MPIVHIHLLRGRPAGELKAIVEGTHAALVEAFKIPEQDRNLLLHQHEPDSFQSAKGPQYTLIEITALPGRSAEAKRRLFAAIVANLERSPGIPREKVMIVIHEPPLTNWGIRGGKPATDVDLGFKLEV
jgi:4-oxalocrotonate tautomerase family enzyme